MYQFVETLFELCIADPIDGLVDPQRLDGGQIPEELITLAHHERDPRQELGAAFLRREPEDTDGAMSWIQQAGKTLQCGGFACPIGPQEADHFTIIDAKRHVVHRPHQLIAPMQQCLQRRTQPGVAMRHPKMAG